MAFLIDSMMNIINEPSIYFNNMLDNAYLTVSNIKNIIPLNLINKNNTYDDTYDDNYYYINNNINNNNIYDNNIYNNDIYDMILQTLLFVSIPIIIALYFQNKKNNKLNKIDKTTNNNTINNDTINNDTINNDTIIEKPKHKLFLDSVNELNNQNDIIMSKLKLNQN